MITITFKLPVIPGNLIIVPGTEPSSTLTSTLLEVELRKLGMPIPALISLKDALELIPGSTVEIFDNGGNQIRKLFVLPPGSIECPCVTLEDWYKILRDAARPATEEETEELVSRGCDILEGYDRLYGS